MNNEMSRKLAGVIELLLESSSRINEAKPQHYWYPLSMATYGVDEIIEAVDSLCSFRTTMWEKTLEFEQRFAAFQGSRYGVMVNSGSSADLLLCFWLMGHGSAHGETLREVLIPAVTWPTQIWSALMAGMTVRLVDVNPDTLNIDGDDLERKVSEHTRAIFLVHLMGNPCPMDRVKAIADKHDLIILEDCCEALGAEWDGLQVGNFGHGGSFSFFFSHHITTMEGGMIVCREPRMADQLKILRAHGWLRNVDPTPYNLTNYDVDPRYAFVNWGLNLRPTEIQAGFGLRQLEKLAIFNKRREALSSTFFEFIDRSPYLSRPSVHKKARPSWFALPIMVNTNAPFRRRDITQYLEEAGVETRPIVAGNVARHPVARLFNNFNNEALPGADAVHERGFYIGLSPVQDEASMGRLLDCFRGFLSQY